MTPKLLCLGAQTPSKALCNKLKEAGFRTSGFSKVFSHNGVHIDLRKKVYRFTMMSREKTENYPEKYRELYTIFDIDKDYEKILDIIQPKNNKNNNTMENYYVSGSKPLIKALIDDYKTLGVEIGAYYASQSKGIILDFKGGYLAADNCSRADWDDRHPIDLSLPKDYEKLLDIAKAHLAEKNKPRFTVGDWVTQRTGGVYLVVGNFNEYGEDVHFTIRPDIANELRFKKATDEQIEATLIRWANRKGLEVGKHVEASLGSCSHYHFIPSSFTYRRGQLLMSVSEHGNASIGSSLGDCHLFHYVYSHGNWAISDIKPYTPTPKLFFGGKEVKVAFVDRNGVPDVIIKSQGVADYYSKMNKIKEYIDARQSFSFGIHKLAINDIKRESPIKFGCTTGTYGEVLDILEACEKLLNNKK